LHCSGTWHAHAAQLGSQEQGMWDHVPAPTWRMHVHWKS
jgi:hypothetical protein